MNQLQTLLSNFQQQQPQSQPPLDSQKFQQMAKGINQNQLIPIIQQARRQGISEQDIEQGIKFLLNMR